MLGYDYSQEPTLLGTNNLYFNEITDGIMTIQNGDLINGNLISCHSLVVNGVDISTVEGSGAQGIQGIHGTNNIFEVPEIHQLPSSNDPYVLDTVSSSTDASGCITYNHQLEFGVPQGIQGIQGIQGPQGDKGDKGDKASGGDILGALVDLGTIAGEAALGATVVQLHTDVGVLQGEVGTLTADVTTLQAKTLNMTHNPGTNKTNFSVNRFAIDNGISDKITLSNDGTISSTNLNFDNIISGPEIEVTNINPHTVLGGIVGTGINIGTSYTGVDVNIINIGNPIANVNLVGLVSCNGCLINNERIHRKIGFVSTWVMIHIGCFLL